MLPSKGLERFRITTCDQRSRSRTGIDSFEQSLIFEKFNRSQHPRNTAPLTRMGLEIAKIMIQAHRGTIGAVS